MKNACLRTVAIAICSLFFVIHSATLRAQQIAFPGAEGAGKLTSGGRGTPSAPTTVFEVTNSTDVNSVGSLRYAVSATAAYRTIVFRVSGTIHLTSKLNIRGNTTIAGQTAPGDGICLADYPVVISGDNVIVRYIRCRMGDKNQKILDANGNPVNGSGGDDALGNLGNKNLIIDHCSVSWSDDEALTVYRGDSVILQWNFITEPLNYSYHFETGDADYEQHGYGGIQGGRHASIHHNLYAHCRNRTPRFAGVSTYSPAVQGADMADFRNNLIYNWGINNIYGGEGGYYNVVNNYLKPGPSTTSRRTQTVAVDSGEGFPYAKYYMAGNFITSSATNSSNNWLGVTMKSGKLSDTVYSKVTTPFDLPAIPTQTPDDAYNAVLAYAGCSLPNRDTLDQRIVNDVKNSTGRIIDVQGGYPHGTPYEQTVNAWPALNSLPAPTDTDHDGMPDDWETAHGSNPNNAADRNNISTDGYTLLEVYLNSLATNANILPLILLNFSASVKHDAATTVNLIWSTADEINTKQFDVERSADGRAFTAIATVNAKNAAAENNYFYTDTKPFENTSYYRLKMIDKDGKFTYSHVVKVIADKLKGLNISPNPASIVLKVEHTAAGAGSEIKILSTEGKSLQSVSVAAGKTSTVLNISALAKGVYLLQYSNGSDKVTMQFIKQ